MITSKEQVDLNEILIPIGLNVPTIAERRIDPVKCRVRLAQYRRAGNEKAFGQIARMDEVYTRSSSA